MFRCKPSPGFSLVELSIVLVILGLLVGGVLAGQSMIRAAELRAVGTEYTRYVTAVQAFRDKYFATPGDITNAQSFWGAYATCPGNVPANVHTGTATCNGNGDYTFNNLTASLNEMFNFWQHLANAGLIEGSYSGVTASSNNGYTSIIGTNVPPSKVAGAGWSVWGGASSYTVASGSLFEGSYGPYGSLFYFGGNVTDHTTTTSVLKPEEMWNIDSKIDDGKPGTGLLRVAENQTSCHDATPSAVTAIAGTANYKLNSTTVACYGIFLLPQ